MSVPGNGPVLQLDMASCTDRGRMREHNEDALACDAVAGVAVLADGMGGYAAGEVASGAAASQVAAELARLKAEYPVLSPADMMQGMHDAIRRVNTQIYRAARKDPRYTGMGTTLVAAAFTGQVAVIAHAGDSRAYLLRDGRLRRMTKDHSLLQERIDLGLIQADDPAGDAVRNLITRALGVDPLLEPEIGVHGMRDGDRVLLCSDGLSDMISDARIEQVLLQHADEPQQAARELVEQANAAGGRDNISVILIGLRLADADSGAS
jgi:protein phosphatase